MSVCIETNLLNIETSQWRWHARAGRQITAGTVITRNSALSHILHSSGSRQRCEWCLAQKEKLYKCSKCHVTKYCGRDCQKRDFSQHRLECKVMTGERRYKTCSKEMKQEIRSILRFFEVFTRLVEKEKNYCYCSDKLDGNGIGTIKCGLDHWRNMAQVPSNLIQISPLIMSIVTEWTAKSLDVEQCLRNFQANNFSIVDELYNTIGQGIYPHAAILNHSCDPTCILRFVNSDLEIVALRDIKKGEELTHSYTDLAQDTATRQRHFRELHGFLCCCRRCQGNLKIKLPRDPTNSLHEWMISDRNPLVENSGADNPLFINTDEAMDTYGGVKLSIAMIQEGRNFIQKAKRHMCNDDIEAEQQELARAINIFQKGPQLSLDLYQARCSYLSALLLSGKEHEAQHQCLAIVAFLLAILPPNHPLIGLQLYTLGDLSADVSIYRWSRKILRVSHGRQHHLVRRLDEQLQSS